MPVVDGVLPIDEDGNRDEGNPINPWQARKYPSGIPRTRLSLKASA